MNMLKLPKWTALTVGAGAILAAAALTTDNALTRAAMAQDQPQRLAQRGNRPGVPADPGGFPGGGGGAEFGGPGGGRPGGGPGFGPPMGMGMGMGGGATMTANTTSVFVLRGNTLYAFDARTLKMTGQANLPQPEFGPGGPGGGFGGPGGPGGGFGGGRPGGGGRPPMDQE